MGLRSYIWMIYAPNDDKTRDHVSMYNYLPASLRIILNVEERVCMVFNSIDQVLRIYLIFQYKDYFTAIPETMMICIENKKTQVALRKRSFSVGNDGSIATSDLIQR